MEKLTELANKHNCDKGTKAFEAHGYTEEYAKYIPQEGKYTLLEIGVYHGDSLRMWKEYNSELVIYGMDIDQNSHSYRKDTDPIWFIGDATDPEFLKIVLKVSKTPDFIIDDGSHNSEDILASLIFLYPKLKKGGYYFIEDLHCQQAHRLNTVQEALKYVYDSEYSHINLVCNEKLLIIQK